MAVYECQAFDLSSALFASFYSIKCMQPHFEASMKPDIYETDFLQWNGTIQRFFRQDTCDLKDNYAIEDSLYTYEQFGVDRKMYVEVIKP